ncbi:MAG: tRNA 2-thiouridine(34) synthase MnmA [Clostridia bacterium]|nr:tRNA 2-thiouridine(34) synthase MnmA [Clostridia bacterium]
MRVLIAMSGGVDSAVAAGIVTAAGHEAEGCTLLLCEGGEGEAARAAEVSRRLGIPHRTLDLRREFFSRVMRPFAEEYARGRTPNPCVLCNRTVKLGLLCEYAEAEGFDAVATGHYARREGDRLRMAKDEGKDQSYMLYTLSAERLSRLLFPLGELTKDEVRRRAAQWGLAEGTERESQDICFVPSGDHAAAVEAILGRQIPAGNYVDKDGTVLGRHRGIVHYTVGQHKGLGIALGRVRYVTAISAERGEVTLGDEEELYRREVALRDVTYVGVAPTAPFRAVAKLRYRARGAECTVYPEGAGARLLFDKAQRAPAPGQSAVLYDGEYVLGGGILQ